MNSARLPSLCLLVIGCLASALMGAGPAPERISTALNVVWREGAPRGRVDVHQGKLGLLEAKAGRIDGNGFTFERTSAPALTLRLREVAVGAGADATVVTVAARSDGFSFFVRDVTPRFPIVLPQLGVAVTVSDDGRTYDQIAAAVLQRDRKTKLQRIEEQPETSFASAGVMTRNQRAPLWLGLGRDVRLFKVTTSLDGDGLEHDMIRVTRASTPVELPELKSQGAAYGYMEGRGQGPIVDVQRFLEGGSLPILHKLLIDDEVQYHTTTFVSFEKSPLRQDTVKGTHFLVADSYNSGHSFTDEQRQRAEKAKAESAIDEEVVLHLRVEAKNTATVPRYAWFKAPKPGWGWADRHAYTYDGSTGFARFPTDRVFCVSQMNGRPMPQEEMAVLLQPGQVVTFDCRLPHEPVSLARAADIARQDFGARLVECRDFWVAKLAKAARVRLPERRVEEMFRAGLLHLDLVSYGAEPDGPIAPSIGIYSPIGTESAPIIQFYNSMGLHDWARRSLGYFLEKQHPDGLIQNFGGYMIETGAFLWSVGEYHRYTGDAAWVKTAMPKLLKSCDYLLAWRNRNKQEGLRHRGYGLLDGKVADPEDPYHQFMLNAYGYLGVSRMVELLKQVDPDRAAALAREAESWKADIRDSLAWAMSRSPVVPLGDGTWSRTAPPWTETVGLRALYATAEKQYTHGSFGVADTLLGPLHLVFCEVLGSDEPVSRELMAYHTDLFYRENVAFSQPYYSRHDWIQLKNGMVKPFLRAWYTAFSALADRQTYTFFEHLHRVSEHKTHEEAWFLMATRWMLYLEDGPALKLLAGVPREWLGDGKMIELDGVASYFGPLSLRVESSVARGRIQAEVACAGARRPSRVLLRLPHPEGKRAVRVQGGTYDPATEIVVIEHFDGKATITAEY